MGMSPPSARNAVTTRDAVQLRASASSSTSVVGPRWTAAGGPLSPLTPTRTSKPECRRPRANRVTQRRVAVVDHEHRVVRSSSIVRIPRLSGLVAGAAGDPVPRGHRSGCGYRPAGWRMPGQLVAHLRKLANPCTTSGRRCASARADFTLQPLKKLLLTSGWVNRYADVAAETPGGCGPCQITRPCSFGVIRRVRIRRRLDWHRGGERRPIRDRTRWPHAARRWAATEHLAAPSAATPDHGHSCTRAVRIRQETGHRLADATPARAPAVRFVGTPA